ncbi:tyrosine-type recombinase/integrase [Psychrobacillus sp. L4]|uniref:tyrosine-type recombinase/integrase n=1 Tax=Psychrobacillus sp. L4 TaxID=3236892 RepID=UPI0036F26FE8
MYSNHIDWTNKTIVVTDSRGKERVVFLTVLAEKHLKNYLLNREDNLKNLFVTERRPYRQIGHRAIQDEIANIVRRTTISKSITPRTFRETFSRIMLEKGYQSNIVESLLGYDSKSSRSETYFVITNHNIWEIIHSRPDF